MIDKCDYLSIICVIYANIYYFRKQKCDFLIELLISRTIRNVGDFTAKMI